MAAPLSDSDRDPWHVDSDDSAASVADELVAPAPARGQGPFRRKRGRPRGTPGNPAQRRALRARRADLEALIVLPQAPASPQVLLSQWLRQVGHGPLKLVVDYIRAHVVSESSQADSDFAHFMQRALGSVPRHLCSTTAEAENLGVTARVFGKIAHRAPFMAFMCARAWLSSMFSHLVRLQESGRYKLLSSVLFKTYDETPLWTRCPEDEAEELVSGSLLRLLDQHTPNASTYAACRTKKHERKLCKVYQISASLGVLCYDRVTQRYASLEMPVVCPLSMGDTNTADVLALLMRHALDMPFWSSLTDHCEHKFEACTNDSAESNLKYERYQDMVKPDTIRLRVACMIHLLHGIQGKTYKTVAKIISGILAMSLSMKPGGSTMKYRQCLEAYLMQHVEVIPSLAPGPNDFRFIYRKRILDLCLGPCFADARRRLILETNLGGDWQSPHVQWYTLDASPNLRAWAKQTAWALIPHKLEEFQRHRWLNKLGSICDSTLMAACHGMLKQVVPLWLQSMGGNQSIPQQPKAQDPWVVDMADSDSDSDIEIDRARGPGASGDWAMYNERQRGDTATFVHSEPLGSLLIISLTLDPQVRLMRGLLDRAGMAWRERQLTHSVLTGQLVLTRIADAASCRLTVAFMTQVRTLLQSGEVWLCLPESLRTHRYLSMAFAMVSRAACGVHGRIHSPCRQYPFVLFRLLEDNSQALAERIRTDPECLLDPFSKLFLSKWRNKLLEQDCHAVLLQLALLLEVDISQTECRHASIRRLLNIRNQTWCTKFADLSGSWLLSRYSKLGVYNSVPAPTLEKEPKKQKKSAGRFRTFLNEYLKGRKFPDIETRRAVFSEAAQDSNK